MGIAVIRYDKRTKAYAGDPVLDIPNLTLYEETIEDAVAAVKLAPKFSDQINADKIFVLGHSLGGMSAPRIAKKAKNLRGIIMVGANASPLADVVLGPTELFICSG